MLFCTQMIFTLLALNQEFLFSDKSTIEMLQHSSISGVVVTMIDRGAKSSPLAGQVAPLHAGNEYEMFFLILST